MGVSIEDVLSEENLKETLEYFAQKKDSHGIDGVKVSELGDYWAVNGANVKRTIRNRTYTLGVIKQQEIVNYKGKKRVISLMNTVDRFIYRALYQKLAPVWKNSFSIYSYAYQENKSVMDAVEQAAKYMEEGHIWCVEFDIQDYFDNIEQDLLYNKIEKQVKDPVILYLIRAYLSCTVLNDHIFLQKERGVIQGGPLSPLLANIYLTEFDRYLERKKYHFCRFGDDINVYCRSYSEAEDIFTDVSRHLAERENLPLNNNKTGIYRGINRKYLSYRFEEKDGHILIKKEQKAYRTVYRDWYTTGIQRIDRTYHLINEGILTKKDFNLLFENDEGKKYIPVETTDSLYIYSNVILTGSFLEFVNDSGLNICLIDKYGEKVGSFVPQNNRRNIKTELKQLRIYDIEELRMGLARKLEIASVSNLRANIRYYERRKVSKALRENVEQLSALIKKLNEAKDITQLMMVEAQARQKYYQCFNEILGDDDFTFEKRTRRPPQDPLNAMISFGNTLLYQKIANEINRTPLDIRIGIVHAAGTRPESLNLDLADLFKPIIVDRAIFTLINKKMITASDFIQVEKDGIYLNKKAKKVFITEFENKLYQKLTIDGQERTYEYLIRSEIQKLKKFVETGENYRPYKYV